jgi:hypothetical protein
MYLGQKFKAKVSLSHGMPFIEVIGKIYSLPTWGRVAECKILHPESITRHFNIHEDRMTMIPKDEAKTL